LITLRELGLLCHNPDDWLLPLNNAMSLYEIDTEERIAYFLAQIAHESNSFLTLEENLNYSEKGLRETFPTHFTGDEFATYSHQPERIANRVYANRMGNGDESSGDGWEFRGRGPIQVTGRNLYRRIGGGIGVNIEADPDLVLDPTYGALASCYIWQAMGCNELADAGDFRGVTRKINGGLNGEADREAMLAVARSAFINA
jgi:putative chitinase